MADKYIIHGATFNGDGTSSAAAASNGGAGAWNNLNVFEGTAPAFGTLAAGDTVYIRSKDAAGSDITRTVVAAISLGSTAATALAPIIWVLDDGAIWAGIDGTLTYTQSGSFTVTVRGANHVAARRRGALVIGTTNTNPTSGTALLSLVGNCAGSRIAATAKTGSNTFIAVQMADDAILEGPVIDWGVLGGASDTLRGLVVSTSTTKKVQIIDPDIRLNSSIVGMPLFYTGNPSVIDVVGGEISGPGATSGQVVYKANDRSRFRSIGLRFPKTMEPVNTLTPPAVPVSAELLACDGEMGAHIEAEWGSATSRTDLNPPTLQALVPTSVPVAWSWRVYPSRVSASGPMRLSSVKLYTGVSGVKTIAQDLLVANTMAAHRGNVWMTVTYQDAATGAIRSISTRDYAGAALAASTADWSATVWGAISFVRRKLEAVTPSAVKQDAPITVTVWGLIRSASVNDIFFIDPDFGVI